MATDACGEIVRNTKIIHDIISPVSGIVSRVNEEAVDDPSIVNAQPYDAWLVEVENAVESTEILSLTNIVR